MKIYLSGGIRDKTAMEASSWRIEVKVWLEKYFPKDESGIEVIDPLRGISYPEEGPITEETIKGGITGNELVHRDMADIARADVILVEMQDPNRPYRGTLFEIAEARRLGKPVVVWSDWAQEDVWLSYYATKILPDLEQCLVFIMEVLR